MKKLLIITLLLVSVLSAYAYTEGIGLRFAPYQGSYNWNDGRNWQDTVLWQRGLPEEVPGEFDETFIPEIDGVIVDSNGLLAETLSVGCWYAPPTASFPVDGVASLTFRDGAGLRIKMQTGSTRFIGDPNNSPTSTGVFFLGQTPDPNILTGEPSGTLTINGGRMDIDHCLVLGAETDAGGLLEMNGGELWVGFNPQDSAIPYLYTPGETFGAAIAVGAIGYGHIEVSGGTIHTKSLSLDPIAPDAAGGTVHFAGTGGGGMIIIECADPTAAGDVLASINGYITSGAMTNAVAVVNGNNVEITELCHYPVGDLNQDCVVNLIDFSMLAAQWQENGF